MAESLERDPEIEAIWRSVLIEGHRSKFYERLPSSPRCAVCAVPFGGLGGMLMGIRGYKPSRKNPNFCNLCDDRLPRGGAEIDLAVLFADVRGSTGMGERLGPSAFASLLNRFYKAATEVLLAHNAMIDKMIGDEVMALFIPAVSGPQYRSIAVRAAVDLVRAVGFGGGREPWLPLGIGVHAGLAYVGKVGTEGVSDYTALGDTINTGSRLQAEAGPGEVVVSEEVYQEVAGSYPGAEQRVVTLRGKEEATPIRILRPAALARV